MKSGKHVILCVDDDPDVLETLQLVLEAHGYLMVAAHTAEEGLKKYESESPDFVIVDLMMEEVDSGTSLVMRLRALGNDAPVYMLSSVGDQLDRSTSYEMLGLDGLFQKPIDPKVLVETLRVKLKR